MTLNKTSQLNVRLPKTLLQDVEEMAQAEHLDRTAVVRKLLMEGLARHRLNRALTLYAEGRISKSRAAELAQVSLYDILDEIERRNLRAPYTPLEARQDLEILRKRYAVKASTRK